MYYVMNLNKAGSIIDIYDSLGEAMELVSNRPEWTIIIRNISLEKRKEK